MDNSALSSIKNHILASLVPFLNEETGEQVRHVYCPNNALISLVTRLIDGRIVEVGLVGSDGMSGLTALMGEDTLPERAVGQLP